jgi:hypothetical protein
LDFGTLPGRYTVLSDLHADATSPAYALVQVLPSMTVMWTSRMPGFVGSGSRSLKLRDATHTDCAFYEGRLSKAQGDWSSRSLLGTLEFSHENQAWKPSFKNGVMEVQSSRFRISGTDRKSYFLGEGYWSGVDRLSFAGGLGVRWSGTTGASPFLNLSTSLKYTLTVADPLQPTLSCRFNVSRLGIVSSIIPSEPGATRFTLRLDKARGELKGSYLMNGQRRYVYASLANLPLEGAEIGTFTAAGWIEITSKMGMQIGKLQVFIRE